MATLRLAAGLRACQLLGRTGMATATYAANVCRPAHQCRTASLAGMRAMSTGSKRPAPHHQAPHSTASLLLVGPDGTALGRYTLAGAQAAASEKGLLLVEVSGPPNHVCRLMSKEQLQQAERDARSKEAGGRAPQEHELRLTSAISGHDLDTKARKLAQLLAQGSRVNVVITKKSGPGQEASTPFNLVRQLEQLVQGAGRLAKAARSEGSRTVATFVPAK
eukprot:comp23028_c0_seq1/m.36798 comp23028_c0_seq1/g.36798  ORF comp23028_c0_seq1/g.36798 comp23028_c0_seq1/m.36798 type:complete len:220 (-) comp23028_c0_seq1:66-725(-)